MMRFNNYLLSTLISLNLSYWALCLYINCKYNPRNFFLGIKTIYLILSMSKISLFIFVSVFALGFFFCKKVIFLTSTTSLKTAKNILGEIISKHLNGDFQLTFEVDSINSLGRIIELDAETKAFIAENHQGYLIKTNKIRKVMHQSSYILISDKETNTLFELLMVFKE